MGKSADGDTVSISQAGQDKLAAMTSMKSSSEATEESSESSNSIDDQIQKVQEQIEKVKEEIEKLQKDPEKNKDQIAANKWINAAAGPVGWTAGSKITGFRN